MEDDIYIVRSKRLSSLFEHYRIPAASPRRLLALSIIQSLDESFDAKLRLNYRSFDKRRCL